MRQDDERSAARGCSRAVQKTIVAFAVVQVKVLDWPDTNEVGVTERLAVATDVVDVVAVAPVPEVVEGEITVAEVDTTAVPLELVAARKYVVDCEGVTVSDPRLARHPLTVTEFPQDVFQDIVDADL